MLHICGGEANNPIQDNLIKWSTPHINSTALSVGQRNVLNVVFELKALF